MGPTHHPKSLHPAPSWVIGVRCSRLLHFLLVTPRATPTSTPYPSTHNDAPPVTPSA